MRIGTFSQLHFLIHFEWTKYSNPSVWGPNLLKPLSSTLCQLLQPPVYGQRKIVQGCNSREHGRGKPATKEALSVWPHHTICSFQPLVFFCGTGDGSRTLSCGVRLYVLLLYLTSAWQLCYLWPKLRHPFCCALSVSGLVSPQRLTVPVCPFLTSGGNSPLTLPALHIWT